MAPLHGRIFHVDPAAFREAREQTRIATAMNDPAMRSALGIPEGSFQYIRKVIDRHGNTWLWNDKLNALVRAGSGGSAMHEYITDQFLDLLANAREVVLADPGNEDDFEQGKGRDTEQAFVSVEESVRRNVFKDGKGLIRSGQVSPLGTPQIAELVKREVELADLIAELEKKVKISFDAKLATSSFDVHVEPEQLAENEAKARERATKDKEIIGHALRMYVDLAELYRMQTAGTPDQRKALSGYSIPQSISHLLGLGGKAGIAFTNDGTVSNDVVLWVLSVMCAGRKGENVQKVADEIHTLVETVSKTGMKPGIIDSDLARSLFLNRRGASFATGFLEALTWLGIGLNKFTTGSSLGGKSILPTDNTYTCADASLKNIQENARDTVAPDMQGFAEYVELDDDDKPAGEKTSLLNSFVDATMINILGPGYTDSSQTSTAYLDGADAILEKFAKYVGSTSRSRAADTGIVATLVDPNELKMSAGEFKARLQEMDRRGVVMHSATRMDDDNLAAIGYHVEATVAISYGASNDAALLEFAKAVHGQRGVPGSSVGISLSVRDRRGVMQTASITPDMIRAGASGTTWNQLTGTEIADFLKNWGRPTTGPMAGRPGYLNVLGRGHYNIDHGAKTMKWENAPSSTAFIDQGGEIVARVGIESAATAIPLSELLDGTTAAAQRAWASIDDVNFASTENRAYDLWIFSGSQDSKGWIVTARSFETAWAGCARLLEQLLGRTAKNMARNPISGMGLLTALQQRFQGKTASGSTIQFAADVTDADHRDLAITEASYTRVKVTITGKDGVARVVDLYFKADPMLAVGLAVPVDDLAIPVDDRGFHYIATPDKDQKLVGEQMRDVQKDVEKYLIELAQRIDDRPGAFPAGRPAATYFDKVLGDLVALNIGYATDLATPPTTAGDLTTYHYSYTSGGTTLQFTAVVDYSTGYTWITTSGGALVNQDFGLSPSLLVRAEAFHKTMQTMVQTATDPTGVDRQVAWVPVDDATGVPHASTTSPGAGDFRMRLVSRVMDGEDVVSETVLGTYQFSVPSSSGGKIRWSWVDSSGEAHQIGSENRMDLDTTVQNFVRLHAAAAVHSYELNDISADRSLSELEVKDIALGSVIAEVARGEGRGEGYKIKVFNLPNGANFISVDFGAVVGVQQIEDAISLITNTRAFFKDLSQRGGSLSGLSVSYDYHSGIIIGGVLEFPPSLKISEQIRGTFVVNTNELRIRPVSNPFSSQVISGGIGRLIDILSEFKQQFGLVGDLSLAVYDVSSHGLAKHLYVSASGQDVDFGGGLHLHPTLTSTLQLDITAQAMQDLDVDFDMMCIGIQGSAEGLSISLDPWSTSEVTLRALIISLNEIIDSDVGVTKIEAARSTYPYQRGDAFLLVVRFNTGKAITLRVGLVKGVPRITQAPGAIAPTSLGAVFKAGGFEMMISSAAYAVPNTRDRAVEQFRAYLGGTTTSPSVNVRFDQWLVHRLLGDAYPADPRNAPIDKVRLRLACEIAGITIDQGTGEPTRDLGNDIKMLRWFVLYASNAGNCEADPQGNVVDFRGWLHAHHLDLGIDQMDWEVFRVFLVSRGADLTYDEFEQYATTAGYI